EPLRRSSGSRSARSACGALAAVSTVIPTSHGRPLRWRRAAQVAHANEPARPHLQGPRSALGVDRCPKSRVLPKTDKAAPGGAASPFFLLGLPDVSGYLQHPLQSSGYG